MRLSVAEVVYGQSHVHEFHKSTVYKSRYLKTIDPETGSIYALPDGLPGATMNKLQLHLVGHSMGALTARHFEHMIFTN